MNKPSTLQRFNLDDLAGYTKERSFSPNSSADFRLFYVGRDNVHESSDDEFEESSKMVKDNRIKFFNKNNTSARKRKRGVIKG